MWIGTKKEKMAAVATQRPGGAHEMTDADCGNAIKSGHIHNEVAPSTGERRQRKIEFLRSGNIQIANKYKPSRSGSEIADTYLHDGPPFICSGPWTLIARGQLAFNLSSLVSRRPISLVILSSFNAPQREKIGTTMG
jgi:hypothetical protein